MPLEHHIVPLDSGEVAHIVGTGKRDGDLRIDGPPSTLAARRAAVASRPWVWLRQVHGARCVDGDAPDATGARADASVGRGRDVVLAVHTADCAPVAFVAPGEGLVAVAHAGWRGLVAGVLEGAVAALRDRGATAVEAVVGPCVSAEAYEFGAEELAVVAARYGTAVRATTADGRPALDLRRGVRTALEGSGVQVRAISSRCTARDASDLFSHRARADVGRQALVVWIGRGDAEEPR